MFVSMVAIPRVQGRPGRGRSITAHGNVGDDNCKVWWFLEIIINSGPEAGSELVTPPDRLESLCLQAG